VQIFVAVANIQAGSLKAEVEKVSTSTAVGRGSVGPDVWAIVPIRRGVDGPPIQRVCGGVLKRKSVKWEVPGGLSGGVGDFRVSSSRGQ